MREDPQAREHLNHVRRALMARFRRDAQQLYNVLWGFILFPGSKDDDPRVKLVMKILDKILPDQREFQPIGDMSGGSGTLELHIHSPEGMEIRRGSKEARDEAIEVQFQRRAEMDEGGEDGKSAQNGQGVQGPP